MKKEVALATILIFGIQPYLLAEEKSDTEIAVFAGGCFWCMEAAYQELEGITGVISGFTGGALKNPTYRGNHRGHYEAVEVSFDPDIISYETLLDIYWVNIDPFDNRGQFCDRGPSYRAAIFANESQKDAAYASRARIVARFPDNRVYTEVLDQSTFYPVEESHQDYYLKNPIRYKFYRTGCRRDARLFEIWGDAAEH